MIPETNIEENQAVSPKPLPLGGVSCSPSLTPQTDRREYEQECNYEVCWEDHSRKIEKMLTRADGLLRRAIVMVDGWAEAEQWRNELIDMQSPENDSGLASAPQDSDS